jgi:hypothetical protein
MTQEKKGKSAKKADWKADPKITMIIKKEWRSDKNLKMSFQESVAKKDKSTKN